MWLFFFLFGFGVVSVWWIQKDVKMIRDDLSYLVDLLEQNPDLVKKATDRAQSNQAQSNQEQSSSKGDSMGSRRELYK